MKTWIHILGLLVLSCRAEAQISATNNGTLYISLNTDILYVAGDLTNNSSSALTNNGNLYIKGNLTNNQASMAIGTGTLYLNGSSAQIAGGTQAFKTYNFVSNNSSGITLNANLSVSGSHTFVAGLISPSVVTPNYLIYEAGSSYSGDGDTKHVDGWVKKYGNTDFSFPVGDATYERTAAIKNLSASSEFNCKYYTPTTNQFNLFSPIVQVHAGEYWRINEISGGSAQITLNWDNSKVPMEPIILSHIRVAGYLSAAWHDGGGSATGNVGTTGSVTSFPASLIGLRFTFGYTDTILPVKIISFTGDRKSGNTNLHWVTENEQNLSRFEVERSDNALNYSSITTVTARNISIHQNYDLVDRAAINKVAYYRLKMIDNNDKYMYSKTVVVSEKDFQSSSFMIQNPVHSTINISNKTGQQGSFEYRLFNSGGQLVLNGTINMDTNGRALLPLSVATSAGMYLLELRNQEILFRQKVIVVK